MKTKDLRRKSDRLLEPGSEGFSPRRLSRRELLKRAGIVGAATALPLSAVVPVRGAEPAQEPFETLTAAASDTLEAIVARLIPTDENGPGAAEARAAHYIDRALTGPLASSRSAYASGLAAVNRYAEESRGRGLRRAWNRGSGRRIEGDGVGPRHRV